MTRFVKIPVLLVVLELFAVCCSKDSALSTYPELKVPVPVSLQNNVDVVKYIKLSTKAINDWSEKLDQLAQECKAFAEKEESEMTFSEKQKLGKAMIEYMAGMGQFAVKMAEIESEGISLTAELSDDQNIAMGKVLEIYRLRNSEINKQYETLNEENEEGPGSTK